jgi:hypothetical protein
LNVGGAASLGRADRRFFLFAYQALGKRKELMAVLPAAQGEEAFHQPQADRRGLVGFRQDKLWRHLDVTHC